MSKSTTILYFQNAKRFLSSCVPSKPTWDLISTETIKKIDDLDIAKLEKLSMLTINSRIEKDLNDVINVVERMCNAPVTKETKTCKLREDDTKLSSTEALTEPSEKWRMRILNNAAYRYEEYFVAPPSKAN